MLQMSKEISELNGNNAGLCVRGISAFLIYKKMQKLRDYEVDNSSTNRSGHRNPEITVQKEEK